METPKALASTLWWEPTQWAGLMGCSGWWYSILSEQPWRVSVGGLTTSCLHLKITLLQSGCGTLRIALSLSLCSNDQRVYTETENGALDRLFLTFVRILGSRGHRSECPSTIGPICAAFRRCYRFCCAFAI